MNNCKSCWVVEQNTKTTKKYAVQVLASDIEECFSSYFNNVVVVVIVFILLFKTVFFVYSKFFFRNKVYFLNQAGPMLGKYCSANHPTTSSKRRVYPSS